MFIDNPDRGFSNFIVQREGLTRQVCAIDFAAARIMAVGDTNFPVVSTATVRIGRVMRIKHGFVERSALEMIDRIAAVPAATIESFLREVPADWMGIEQREMICGLWSGKHLQERVSSLRAGIAGESLL